MKHIAGWFRRNRTLMAQAVDLQRQLQEAREENDSLDRAYDIVCEQVRHEEGSHNYTRTQLHRVARERDECYRQHRLAEMRRKNKERELRLAAKELREHYLENEEE